MGTLYDDDVIAWVEQQVALLRKGHWSELDIDNIVEEIEDVGKSEQRELRSRLGVLISHLLKWKYQPDRQGHSWRLTIRAQRDSIAYDVKKCPSLKRLLRDPHWMQSTYRHARVEAEAETGVYGMTAALPWNLEQLLSQEFFPE
jgi:hypothetical protein